MKKIILILLACINCMVSNAQRYMHYYMNDSSYYGFYTNDISSVDHYMEDGNYYSAVRIGEKNYRIPVDKIDSVEFEGCSIEDDNFIGKYRIYELDYDNADFKFKKAFVDNRAMLLASKNGDFGANDTILLASTCNDFRCIFITNSNGYISKFFNGESFLYFDWEDENNANIIELNDEGYQIIQSVNRYSTNNKTRKIPDIINKVFFEQVGEFSDDIDAILGTYLGNINSRCGKFFKALEEVKNNPELHNQILVIDGLLIAGDIAGIVGSVASGIPTAGLSSAAFVHSVGSLFGNIIGTLNDMWPDSEQMKRYKDYYQNKYNIHISTLPEENVTYNSATLNGEFSSLNGINGELFFDLIGTDDDKSTPATAERITDNSFLIHGNATGLKPGEIYIYTAKYKCTIDGLEFTYQSDNQDDFMTQFPSAHTGEASNIEDDYAEITCSYHNVPEGATCGVEYTWDGGTARQTAQRGGDGEKTIRLTSLKPNTEYTCTAYVEIDGIPTYAENSTGFKTPPEEIEEADLTGWWTFNDAQGTDGGRVHRVEFYANGTTNAFYGVNRLYWNVDGRNINIRWPSGGGSSVWWEYRGTFNEEFTVATGDAFYCFVNNVTGDYWESKSDYQFSLSR